LLQTEVPRERPDHRQIHPHRRRRRWPAAATATGETPAGGGDHIGVARTRSAPADPERLHGAPGRRLHRAAAPRPARLTGGRRGRGLAPELRAKARPDKIRLGTIRDGKRTIALTRRDYTDAELGAELDRGERLRRLAAHAREHGHELGPMAAPGRREHHGMHALHRARLRPHARRIGRRSGRSVGAVRVPRHSRVTTLPALPQLVNRHKGYRALMCTPARPTSPTRSRNGA